jgi:hypothetical protein
MIELNCGLSPFNLYGQINSFSANIRNGVQAQVYKLFGKRSTVSRHVALPMDLQRTFQVKKLRVVPKKAAFIHREWQISK